MRVNPKIYSLADDKEPFDSQDIDGRKVELFYLNDYPEIFEENVGRSKFAVWSSADGYNYRIYVEQGYYERVKPLYGSRINKIWVDFWDSANNLANKFSYRLFIPITLVVLIAYYLLSNYVIPSEYTMLFSIAVFGTFIIVLVTINRYVKSKIAQKNSDSVEEIRKTLGAKKFEELIEAQRSYTEEFYKKRYPDAEEQAEDSEEPVEEQAKETTEEKTQEQVEESTEEVKEETVTENTEETTEDTVKKD